MSLFPNSSQCRFEVLASLSGGDGCEALSEEDVGAAVELRLEREDVLHVGVVGEGHELLEHVPRNLMGAFHIITNLVVDSLTNQQLSMS